MSNLGIFFVASIFFSSLISYGLGYAKGKLEGFFDKKIAEQCGYHKAMDEVLEIVGKE